MRLWRKFLDDDNGYLMQTEFSYNRTPVMIDAQTEGNFARFFNHSSLPVTSRHGVNAVFAGLHLDGRPVYFFIAARDIEPGEQILIDYGDDYWKALGIDPLPF